MAFDVVRPVYTVYQYTESIYKVVKFKHTDSLPRFEDSTNEKSDTVRFDSSISRSRRIVLELALCNHWDYFFTGTIAPDKHDRYDWDTLRKKFKESVKYWRKKYDCDILYLVIPEHHKNGAWHIHGFIAGLPSSRLAKFVKGVHPYKLVKAGYQMWVDFDKKFGYCSLGEIRSKAAASFYVTKYITKDMASRRSEFGKHLYSASDGLQRAVKSFDVYSHSPILDSFITNDYDFCSTGMVFNADWTFGSDIDDAVFDELPLPSYTLEPEDIESVDLFAELEQLIVKGW